MAKERKDTSGVEAPAPQERKVSIDEFFVTFHAERMWVDALKVHLGEEPRTISEWKTELEKFKKLPSK